MTATAQKKRGEFSPADVTVKECKGCGGDFTRNLRESQTQFRWRAYCNEECKAQGRQRQRQYIVGEVRFLVGTDSSENLAKRLGYSINYVRDILSGEGEPELAARFMEYSHKKPVTCDICMRSVTPDDLEKHQASSRCKPPWGRA